MKYKKYIIRSIILALLLAAKSYSVYYIRKETIVIMRSGIALLIKSKKQNCWNLNLEMATMKKERKGIVI